MAKKNGIISFNTVLSIIIVCIGVFSLIVVVSVMNGFQSAIKDKILDMDSHIFVTNSFINRELNIENYEKLKKNIESVIDVKSAYPSVEGMAIFGFKKPVAVRGMGGMAYIPPSMEKFLIDGQEDRRKSGLSEGIKRFTGGKEIFIGTEMALQYNIDAGDKVELIVAKGRHNIWTNMQPAKDVFKVIGFFKTQNYELDNGLIVMSLKSAQSLYDIGNMVSSLRVIVFDVYQTKKIAKKINHKTGFKYNIRTTEEMNTNLFYALRLEKLIIMIILFIVIISALITIMGTLVMIVSEKKRSIGILKSMGSKPGSITLIFIFEGFFIGIAGSVIGTFLGLAVSININAIIICIENTINQISRQLYNLFGLAGYDPISLIPKNIYYLDYIPTKISPEFVIFLIIITVFLSSVAAVFPSWYASRLQPIETIRYE